MAHFLRSTPLRWAFLALALAVCLAVVLSIDSTPGHSQPAPLSSPTAGYSIFDRPVSTSDMPATDLNDGTFISRQIATGNPALHQWITISGETICVQIDALVNGSDAQPRACNSAATLDNTHELLILGVDGGPTAGIPSKEGVEGVKGRASDIPPVLLVGLAPDGVSHVEVSFSDGQVQTVPAQDNGFHLYTNGRTPTNISWTTPDGARHSE